VQHLIAAINAGWSLLVPLDQSGADAFRKLARAIMVSLSEKSDMAAFSEMPALNP